MKKSLWLWIKLKERRKKKEKEEKRRDCLYNIMWMSVVCINQFADADHSVNKDAKNNI